MAMDPAECLTAGSIMMPPGGSLGRATHPFIEVLIVMNGRLSVKIDGRAVSAGPGDSVVYPPRAVHQEFTEGSAPVQYFHMAGYGELEAHVGHVVPDRSGRLTVLARWLYEEKTSPDHVRRRGTMTLLFAAVLDELNRLARPRVVSRLDSVREWMQGNPEITHTIDSLAAMAKMSRCHFAREYKKVFGITPMSDLRLIRVDEACHLLLTTDLPLKSIAERSGFCDEYHFSRVFRQLRRMSPGEFRKTH
ncbi:MAG: hypothetical protein A3K19_08245 [Lentisphaerae bacterium RIFOXYB12_FULL_65_16]|nr:MAG: hypothetical protein A3K18_00245 [Lentisphaerae bacterium RIFOXYA12_64_32]OGV89860.1 MAG: hypothetical protein A3K19_08245 [Lentisphaerae bacterium RIFOXYB12_FULL_65_16]